MWTGVCQKCSCEPSHKKNPSMEGQPSHLIQSSASSICLMHMIHDLPWLAMAYILQLLSSGIPEAGNTSSVTFNIKTRLKVLQQCLSHVVRNQAHLQSVRLKYSMYPHPPQKKKKSTFLSFSFLEGSLSTHPATGSLVKRSNRVIRLAEMVTTTAEAAVTVAPQGAASPVPLFSTERSPRMDLGPTLFKTCAFCYCHGWHVLRLSGGQHHCRFEHENNLVQNRSSRNSMEYKVCNKIPIQWFKKKRHQGPFHPEWC